MAVHVVTRPTTEVTTFLASMSHRAVAQPPAHHQSRRHFPNRMIARDNASRSPCVATSVAPAAWPIVAGVSATSAESGHCPRCQPLLRQPRPSGRKPRGARTATRNERLLNCSACGLTTSRGIRLPSIHVAEQLQSRTTAQPPSQHHEHEHAPNRTVARGSVSRNPRVAASVTPMHC